MTKTQINEILTGIFGNTNYAVYIFPEASTSDNHWDHVSIKEYEKNTTRKPGCDPIVSITRSFSFGKQFWFNELGEEAKSFLKSELYDQIEQIAKDVMEANKTNMQ